MFQDSTMSDAGGYMSSTQASPSTGKKSAKDGTITPVAIADIFKGMQSPDGFKIGDNNINVVTIVGIVNSVRVESTGIFYEFDDMTSKPIKVHQWTTDPEEGIKPLMENTYARVIGTSRDNKGDIFVLAHTITPLTDMNELTTHLLEIIDAKLHLNKCLDKAQVPMEIDRRDTNANFSYSNSDFSAGGIPGVSGKVLSAIKTCTDDRGCDIQYICKISKLTMEDVKKGLAMLQEEGHIFPTIDNYHFAASS